MRNVIYGRPPKGPRLFLIWGLARFRGPLLGIGVFCWAPKPVLRPQRKWSLASLRPAGRRPAGRIHRAFTARYRCRRGAPGLISNLAQDLASDLDRSGEATSSFPALPSPLNPLYALKLYDLLAKFFFKAFHNPRAEVKDRYLHF